MTSQRCYQSKLTGWRGGNGTSYRIALKKGQTNRLLANFVGGALSWDEETAANPFTIRGMLQRKEKYYIDHLTLTLLGLCTQVF